ISSSSGASSLFSPSSAISSGATRYGTAPARSAASIVSDAHDERVLPCVISTARSDRSDASARLMGRTPCTIISAARLRLVRLPSRVSQYWKVAFLVDTALVRRGRESGDIVWAGPLYGDAPPGRRLLRAYRDSVPVGRLRVTPRGAR